MKNNNIIIFKNDGVGDFMLFSPCLKIIKDNIENAHITLLCSEIAYPIAKNNKYIDKCIVLGNKNLIELLLNYFKTLFLTRYQFLFQFDGKNKSYRISYFVNAKIKSTICFVKKRSFFNVNYDIFRPSKILLKMFFSNYVYRESDYSVKLEKELIITYQSLYFKIFENLKFQINSRKNIFFLDNSYNDFFEKFHEKEIRNNYYLFHFDERWDLFDNKIYENILKLLKKISKKNKLIITSGVKSFIFLNILENNFKTFNYEKNNLIEKNFIENNEIILLKNMPLNLLAFFIKNSQKNFSAHSGPIIHIGAAFKKETIDIIKKNKNNELDRWIPTVSNYKRVNFENIDNEFIKNFSI